METKGTAFFVENPRTTADLIFPHPLEQEQCFEIVRTVKLGKFDYENFI